MRKSRRKWSKRRGGGVEKEEATGIKKKEERGCMRMKNGKRQIETPGMGKVKKNVN